MPHYASTWDAITRIVADDGLKGLRGHERVASGRRLHQLCILLLVHRREDDVKSAKSTAPPPSMAVELALGAVAGALAQLFTIPVAVVTTRQQTAKGDERKGLLATAREVVEGPDGVSGLWRGLKASLVLVINPAITYGAYERLRTRFFRDKTNLRPWEAFRESSRPFSLSTHADVSNIVSRTQSWGPRPKGGHDCHPAAYCRQGRLTVQAASLQERKAVESFGEVMRFIVEHEGPLALFKGIAPQIFKGFLVQGILMMAKERCVSGPCLVYYQSPIVILLDGRLQHRVELLFILGAVLEVGQGSTAAESGRHRLDCGPTGRPQRHVEAVHEILIAI